MTESEEQTLELRKTPSRGPFRLRLTSPGKEQQRTLRLGQVLTLGSGDDADIQVPDPTVSGLHCRLEVLATGLEVVDLASRNGVVLGSGWVGQALLSGPRSEFSIGATTVHIESVEHASSADDLGLLGKSESLARVRDAIRKCAALRAPVLIVGESGTGKDLVARALHRLSKRGGAYVPLNVAALPDGLVDAELFGHARGAFTGAVASRPGAFELAHKGTLFLDELAELSPTGQAKLLRVIEDGVVRPIGAAETLRVDVRAISATCAPLLERVGAGKFRLDLYHRLAMLIIEVPPLRRRSADIPLLAESFLRERAGELGPKHLLPSTVDFLAEQPWPGNVRQLFGALYRAAAMSEAEALCPTHFQLGEVARVRSAIPSPSEARLLLERHGSTSAAARSLGMPRSTFRAILARSGGPARAVDHDNEAATSPTVATVSRLALPR
jgi:DNA-binding NtrC family response regulator